MAFLDIVRREGIKSCVHLLKQGRGLAARTGDVRLAVEEDKDCEEGGRRRKKEGGGD